MLNRIAALPLLLVVAGSVAACSAGSWAEDQSDQTSNLSADGPDGKNDGSGATTSVAYGPCRASRGAIMNSVSSARSAAISRGFEWLDADVPFSMSGRRDSYRTDCSGFVSMCLQLGAPGQTTSTLGQSGSKTHRLGSYDDLVPADALVDAGHHSFIFLGWNDTNHSGMCVLEQSSTKNDMQFRVRMASSLRSEGFVAVRADKFRNDTEFNGQNLGNGAGLDEGKEDDNTGTGTGTGTVENDPCTQSVSIRDVCTDAKARSGIECGRVTDSCGRRVDCSVLREFACSDEGDTCELNRCKRCQPKAPVDICNDAKAKSGVECGSVPDGCGGVVNCDSIPGFACKDGQKCGLVNTNRCAADPSAPTPADPSPSTTPDGSETTPSNTTGDEGDQGDTSEDNDADKSADNGGKDDGKTSTTKKPKTASGGCSTTGTGTTSSSGLSAMIMIGAIIAGLRRRKK